MSKAERKRQRVVLLDAALRSQFARLLVTEQATVLAELDVQSLDIFLLRTRSPNERKYAMSLVQLTLIKRGEVLWDPTRLELSRQLDTQISYIRRALLLDQ